MKCMTNHAWTDFKERGVGWKICMYCRNFKDTKGNTFFSEILYTPEGRAYFHKRRK